VKIIFADQFSDPGGGQQCLMDLLPAIVERGWQPLVMAPGDGEMLHWCGRNNIPTRRLPLSNYSSGSKSPADGLRFALDRPRVGAAIRTAAVDHGCNLLYVNGPRVLPHVAGTELPIIFHAHHGIGGKVSRALTARVLEQAKIPVIAVSQFVARQFPLPDVSVIYNGVPDCAGKRTGTDGALRIGMLGRIAPEKGQLDFVRAARLIQQQLPGLRFEIFGSPLFSGDEYERTVRGQSRDLPVTFHGWQKASTALEEMDVLAAPSGPDEGACRAIPEAFSAGVAVVAYRSGGIPEFIEHGRTGILTDDRSPESLATSILELIRQPGLRGRLSAAARAEWNARFTLEAYRQRICERIQDRASR
jgi:glycosyltransferase involved in cell wall biosynthesis